MSLDSPLIELQGIGRRYEGRAGTPVTALSNVWLSFYSGEFVCVTGPSGSGKTTLMNILGCLDRPDSGIYRFAGRQVNKLNQDGLAWLRRKAFGFVFQNYNLLASATAFENVEIPAVYAGLEPSVRRARALGLLATLGLKERVTHRPAALSGGEQQRVSIARALMNGGRVILADEPTGALDTRSGDEVLNLLEQLSKNGHTVILISHNQQVAARAKRRIELLDGYVVADSGPTPDSGSSPLTDSRPVPTQSRLNLLMHLVQRLRSILTSLTANLLRTQRVRAMLTVFSILMGVWSVVTMLTIAEGGYRQTMSGVNRLGADRLEVRGNLLQDDALLSLTLEDAQAIAEQLPNVRRVLPSFSQRMTLRYDATSIEGTVQSYAAIASEAAAIEEAPKMERGQFITAYDNENRNQVAVISTGMQKRLFAHDQDPLEQYIMVANVPFQIKGVLADQVDTASLPIWFIAPESERIVIPYNSGAALLHGTNRLQSLGVYVRDPNQISATANTIRKILIQSYGQDGFLVSYSGDKVEQAGQIRSMLWLSLGTVGGIALLAGGLGVMAIMLMAVNERIREIGIRMAAGARRRDITRQFVIEAVVLATVGGLLGVITALATLPLVKSFGVPAVFSPLIMLSAVISAVGTGLVFGIVPARRASMLNPVDALATKN